MPNPLRQLISSQVRDLFADPSGQKIELGGADDGLLGKDAVSRRVHGDVTTMMIGGVSSLLLQMLHPIALAGVWDHSNFRRDMQGRLRRTAAFIGITTYGDTAHAEAAISRVRNIHHRVTGTMPDGTDYRAEDPHLLAWVHAAETISFLRAWVRYREPLMPRREQDRYFAEQAIVGKALGADPVPKNRIAMERLIESYRPELRSDERTREIVRILLRAQPRSLGIAPFQLVATQAAVELLPPWARKMHRLPLPRLARPALRGGAFGMTQMLRWAMASRD